MKKLLQTISSAARPLGFPIISPTFSLRIPGNVETQNAAIDRLMKKQERYETACKKWRVKSKLVRNFFEC